jgi:peptidoglycan/LPS O-acetylase OafA/YrhL
VTAPATLTPPPGNPRFPLVDSMRAIAALSVVAYHVAFFARATEHGWTGALLSRLGVGVTIFFVISGFVLYRPMVRARWDGERPRPVGDYAGRRALRIVPAYWLALTVLAIVPGLTGVFTDRWWVYYGFLQVYDGDTIIRGIGPAWSLGTEVVFYAALPLLALALGRAWGGDRHRGVRAELALLALLGLASFGFRAAIELGGGELYLTQTILGTFDGFAIGMGLAVASVALADRDAQPAVVRLVTRRPGLAWLAALAAFAAAAAIGGPDPAFVLATDTPAGEALAVRVLGLVTAVALLAPALFGDHAGGAPRRLLALPQLAWLGAISYGIYLWHFPIVQRVTVGSDMDGFPGGSVWKIGAISVPIVIACAALSYHLLERPLLERAPRRGPRLSAGVTRRW